MNFSLKVSSAPSLREQVAARLREGIANGHLAPGERLKERVLCELMGVSRTSLREALRELENEGLVTSVLNRGIVVATIDPDIARSTFELREALEVLAVKLFVERAGPREQAGLAMAFDEMQDAYASGETSRILESKVGFYDAIMDGTGNALLNTSLRGIYVRVSQLRSASLTQPSRRNDSLVEFAEMFEAMKRRSPAQAEEACRRHVRNAAAVALAGIATAATPPAPAASAKRRKEAVTTA